MPPPDDRDRSRPSPRLRIRPPVRPWRIAVGGGLIVASVISGWALMAGASERHEVLILRRAVAAGEAVSGDDLGVVAIGTDDGVASVSAASAGEYIGQHARYRLAAGALLTADDLQERPLVGPGRVLVAIVAAAGDVPREIAAGDEVVLIVGNTGQCDGAAAASVVDATVTFIAARDAAATALPISVEVDESAVALVATADRVTVARPNSPAVAAVVRAPAAADACTPADVAADSTSDGADGVVEGPDASVTLPVPTGVTPLDPADVLLEPSPSS